MEHLVTRDGRLRLWTTLRRALPDEVYAYWTERAKLAAWWPEGAEFTPNETERSRRLVFELTAGAGSPFSEGRAVIDFERRDEDTLLTVTQSPSTEGTKEALLAAWTRLFSRLKGALERSS